jgi:uncharacterized protein YndB with AHSA1/START domain
LRFTGGSEDVKEYRFVDHWSIRAPIGEVFNHIADARTYKQWWKAYQNVRVLRDVPFPYVGGQAELLIRSPFGYQLRLDAEISESRPPYYLKTPVRGNLNGVGIWEFREEGGMTHATWTWIVRSDHPLLNRLEWFAKPIFALSHVLVSRSGRQGLKRLLEPQSAVDPFPIP